MRVRGVPDQHDLDRLSRGISLEGRRTAPAEVELTKVIDAESGQQALLSFVIREGRNRQVRNMCDAIGHPVVRLRRVRIGPITDEHIRPGEFRDLTPREVALLRKRRDRSHSFLRAPRRLPVSPVQPEGPRRASAAAASASTSPERGATPRRRAANPVYNGPAQKRIRRQISPTAGGWSTSAWVISGVEQLGHAPAARAQIGGEQL